MVEIMYWQLWMLHLLLGSLSPSENSGRGNDLQKEFSGFPDCDQDFTLERVCDLTWVILPFEIVLGILLPQSFHSAPAAVHTLYLRHY